MDTPNEQKNITRLQKKCQALGLNSSSYISNRQLFLDSLWAQAVCCRNFPAIEIDIAPANQADIIKVDDSEYLMKQEVIVSDIHLSSQDIIHSKNLGYV